MSHLLESVRIQNSKVTVATVAGQGREYDRVLTIGAISAYKSAGVSRLALDGQAS